MSQCPYYCSLRDFHPETTIFDKAKTTNKQTLEGSSTARTASTATKERECVSHNNRNVNIAIYFQFCFVVQHVHRS